MIAQKGSFTCQAGTLHFTAELNDELHGLMNASAAGSCAGGSLLDGWASVSNGD